MQDYKQQASNMRFSDRIEWSDRFLNIGNLKTNPSLFPLVVKVESGHYGASDESSVYIDEVILLHGWGMQKRLVAKNLAGKAISVPVDKGHILYYAGRKGQNAKIKYKKSDRHTVEDVLKLHDLPFYGHFEPKGCMKTHSPCAEFDAYTFGMCKMESIYDHRYLVTSHINDEGAINVKDVYYIPLFTDIDFYVAKNIKGCSPEFFHFYVQAYLQYTQALNLDTAIPKKLLRIMTYSYPLDLEDEVSGLAISATQFPLPTTPNDQLTLLKADTHKKPLNRAGPKSPPISPMKQRALPPLPMAAITEYSPSSSSSGESYDEATSFGTLSRMFAKKTGRRISPVEEINSEVKHLFSRLLAASNDNSPVPLGVVSSGNNGVSTGVSPSSSAQTPAVYCTTMPVSPSIPVACISPTSVKKTPPPVAPKPKQIPRSISLNTNPVAPKPELIPRSVSLDTNPVTNSVRSLSQRPNFMLPLPKSESKGAYFERLQDVPLNLAALNESQISNCLRLLKLEAYIAQFKHHNFDGALLVAMNEKDFASIGMAGFEAKKLTRFIQGWRPKLDK